MNSCEQELRENVEESVKEFLPETIKEPVVVPALGDEERRAKIRTERGARAGSPPDEDLH